MPFADHHGLDEGRETRDGVLMVLQLSEIAADGVAAEHGPGKALQRHRPLFFLG